MKRIFASLLVVATVSVASADVFDINLNVANDPNGLLSGIFEVPANGTLATGGEVGTGIVFDHDLGLTINLAYGLFGFTPLQGDFTGTHIHKAAAGVGGPVLINLDSGATDIHTAIGTKAGFFAGTVPLTSPQIDDLFNNLLYINIHSTSFPGGEIRAQLIPSTVPEPSTLVFVGGGLALLYFFRRRTA